MLHERKRTYVRVCTYDRARTFVAAEAFVSQFVYIVFVKKSHFRKGCTTIIELLELFCFRNFSCKSFPIAFLDTLTSVNLTADVPPAIQSS